MGIVRRGAPTEFILYLQQQFEVRHFVETGTFAGRTAVWAAAHFAQVATVENARVIYDKTVAEHGHITNISFRFGHSLAFLKELVPTLDASAIFWLDSHWSGGDTYGAEDECPVLDEINLINQSSGNHFLLIDDARLFTAPPPLPHRIEAWPAIDAVVAALKAGAQERYVAIYDDVIIAVPQAAKGAVTAWLQNAITQEERTLAQARVGRLQRGVNLIGEGLQLVGASALAKLQSSTRGKG